MIKRPPYERSLQIAAALARVFGLLTIVVGGMVLFGGKDSADLAGEVVPFVLWFNFGAGFAYLAAGFGLAHRKTWGFWLAVAIAVASALVLAALGLHIGRGEPFEPRTLGAMTLRTGGWWVIVWIAARAGLAR